jgi:hypothetical protein
LRFAAIATTDVTEPEGVASSHGPPGDELVESPRGDGGGVSQGTGTSFAQSGSDDSRDPGQVVRKPPLARGAVAASDVARHRPNLIVVKSPRWEN